MSVEYRGGREREREREGQCRRHGHERIASSVLEDDTMSIVSCSCVYVRRPHALLTYAYGVYVCVCVYVLCTCVIMELTCKCVRLSTEGQHSEAVKGAARAVRGSKISLEEARAILNLPASASLEDALQRYRHLYEKNEEAGASYIQGRVYRAMERLEGEYGGGPITGWKGGGDEQQSSSSTDAGTQEKQAGGGSGGGT